MWLLRITADVSVANSLQTVQTNLVWTCECLHWRQQWSLNTCGPHFIGGLCEHLIYHCLEVIKLQHPELCGRPLKTLVAGVQVQTPLCTYLRNTWPESIFSNPAALCLFPSRGLRELFVLTSAFHITNKSRFLLDRGELLPCIIK